MTQPRGQQIKSVNTRYSVLPTVVLPGSNSAFYHFSVFPYPLGGAAEDVPASVRGTVISPFAVLAGDAFVVRIDGAPAVTVVLASTDTTVGRVVLKINAAVGSQVASNDDGFLVLRSPTAGISSSIALSDSVAGTLSKLGLSVGTFLGADAGTDGVLTRTPDGLGGNAPHSTQDGKNLVTDGGKLVYYESSGSDRKMMQIVPGGVPMVAKLTESFPNCVATFCAKLFPRTKVRTLGSFFSLLDGTNALSLSVNGHGFVVTFSSPSYMRDTVLDAINSAYAAAASVSDPWARADGTVQSPFRSLSGTSFTVEIDGGSPQVVTFSTEQTVAEVVGRINSVLSPSGSYAFAVSGPSGQFLAIRSLNSNGRLSSLKIYSGNSCLSRLGIRPGFYGGCYVATAYGPDEIEISSVFRGSRNGGSPDIIVGGSSTTLSRMGLSAGSYSAPGSAQYEPVETPFMDPSMSFSPFRVLMCYPSVLEFGDVPMDTDSAIQSYLAKSAGSNVDGNNNTVVDTQSGSIASSSFARGFFDVGKPVVSPSDGLPALGGEDVNVVDSVVKQITRVTPTDIVQAVVGSRFETPGKPGNQSPTSPLMDFVVDPTDVYTSGRGYRFFVGSTNPAFSVFDDPTQAMPIFQSFFAMELGRTLRFSGAEGRLADPNIIASAGGVPGNLGYMRLSSSVDDYLKIAGKRALATLVPGYNLLQSVNSRYEVVLGDGTGSFGDFNGPGALKKARDFLVSVGATAARIVFLPGSYLESVSSDFSGFTDLDIDGVYPAGLSTTSAVTLQFGTGSLTDSGIVASIQMGSFKLRNIEVTHATPLRNAVSVAAHNVEVDGCALHSPVTFANSFLFDFKNTRGDVSVALGYAVRIVYNDIGIPGGPGSVAYADVRVRDCRLSSGQDAPVVRIDEGVSGKLVRFRVLEISGCTMTPGNCTVNSRVIQAASGIGVLGIEPTVSAFDGSNVGFVFERIRIADTDIVSGAIGFTGTYAPTAVFLLPGGAAGPASWNISSSPGSMLNEVTIENVNVSISNGSSFQTSSGMNTATVCVGGVGIMADPANPAKVPEQPGVLTVRNLHVDCQRAVFGPSSTSMITFFADYRSPSGVIGDLPSGLIALSGVHVRTEEVMVKNSLSDGGNPALLIASYAEISMDGFYEAPTFLSLGLPIPTCRVRIRDVFTSSMVMKNIHIWGGFQIGDWWTVGAITFEAMNPSYRQRVLSDFSIRGFFTSSGNLNAGVSFNGFSYPTNCIPNNKDVCGGMTLERGYIGNDLLNTFQGMSVGIRLSQDTTLRGGNLTVRSVTIDTMWFQGIKADFGTLIGPVSIEDCTVIFCGNSTSVSGISLTSSNTNINHAPFYPPSSFSLRGNTVSCNGAISFSSYTGIQISVRDVNSNGSTLLFFGTRVSMYGNFCSDGLGSHAQINTCQSYNTNLPNAFTGIDLPIYGMETGYSGQTGSFASFGDGRGYLLGVRMMHNYAKLASNFSYSG